MTGAPDTARESCTHRGFIRKDKAHRGGTAFTTPSVLGQGAFLQEAAMDIGQRALDYHKNGYNCAQSVFAACCEYTGMDEKTALAISAGFGRRREKRRALRSGHRRHNGRRTRFPV